MENPSRTPYAELRSRGWQLIATLSSSKETGVLSLWQLGPRIIIAHTLPDGNGWELYRPVSVSIKTALTLEDLDAWASPLKP